MSAATSVAVLGTGVMGAPMAANLAHAGFEVRVWNRSRSKAEALARVGAVVCDTPGEACSSTYVVVSMLADGPTVEAVVDGALSQAAPGAVWAQMSTVGADWADRLAELADGAGVGYADAPVLGTKEPAESGELLVLASGADELAERCAPVFDAVGRHTMWVGPAGAGSRLKLVVNDWLVALVGALAESVSLSRRLGIDPAVFLQAIDGGPIGAPYAQSKGKAMLAGEFPTSFPLRLALKDARLVRDAAEQAGLSASLATTMVEAFSAAAEAGHGDKDMAAVLQAWEPTA
jgi:3-hydroxyisobutyrate dehydrogenase